MTQESQYTWEDAVATIGQDFGEGEVHVADEAIECTSVVCYGQIFGDHQSHPWDRAVARQAGYRYVVAPWSGLRQTWINL